MAFVGGLPLRVEKAGDNTWVLLRALLYVGRHGKYRVPVGYRTDFASVPRLLWVLFPQSGRWDPAAVVHDWLITNGLLGEVEITSAQVDAEFRRALEAVNVGFVRRWLMWTGVRWAAVGTKVRRPGWLKTLPQLVAVTAVELAPLVGAAWAALALIK
jgi:hypothetical protein